MSEGGVPLTGCGWEGSTMFLEERQDAIAVLLSAEGRVKVVDLAKRFDVSEDCIRKDLKKLSDRGLCKRVYGGAVAAKVAPDPSVQARMGRNLAEKHAIALRAYELIDEGDTVFLDGATTNLPLAELLRDGCCRCTVVSNMIDILQIAGSNPNLSVVASGGTMSIEVNGFIGAQAAESLGRMRFNKSFIGILGINDDDGGVTTFCADDGLLKSKVMERSVQTYAVTTVDKIGLLGAYQFATLDEFTAVITDGESENRRDLELLGATLL